MTASRAFGTVPPEPAAYRGLDVLAPSFRARLATVLDILRADGHAPIVVDTVRYPTRQRWLYGFGRDYSDGRANGRPVTHATDVDETWHGYGLAADVIDAVTGYRDLAFFGALHQAARRVGLRSGADWDHDGETRDERFVDWPHVQFGPPMRRSPSPRAARLYEDGGIIHVWKEVGAAGTDRDAFGAAATAFERVRWR